MNYRPPAAVSARWTAPASVVARPSIVRDPPAAGTWQVKR
jgi:hypothetical protein